MIERIKEWLDREPFVPFRIVMTSGGTFEVTSPYQVAIGITQFDYFYPKSDRAAMARINQVVSVESLEANR